MKDQDKTKQQLIEELAMLHRIIDEYEKLEDQRKQTKKSLRESEEKYEDLYNNYPDMFCSFEAKSAKIIQCNQALLATLGYTREEILGRHISEIYHPDSEEKRKEFFETFALTGEGRNEELQLLRKGGNPLDVSSNVSSVRDDDGNIVYFRSIWRDITDPKRVEEELLESSEFTAGVLESISDGFFSLNNDMVITYYNKAVEQLLGRKSEDVLGNHFFDAFPNARGSIFEEKYALAIKEKKQQSYEFYFGVDPHKYCYNIRVHPYKNGIHVYFQLITDHKRAEEALRKSEERFRALFENKSSCILIIEDRVIKYVNQAALDTFGYNEEEMIGNDTSIINNSKEKYEEGEHIIYEAFEENGFWHGEWPYRKKDGEVVWMDTDYSQLPQDEILVILIDVTDRKAAESALLESEGKWESLIENSPDHIMMLDCDANILSSNRTEPDITQDEAIGKSVHDFIPPEFRKVNLECIKRVKETEKTDNYFTEYRSQNGEVKYFEVRISPVFESEIIVGFISVSIDITDRKQADETLWKSEEKYNDFYDNYPDMLCSYEAKSSRIIQCNLTLATALGYTKEEIFGHHISKIYHPDSEEKRKKYFKTFTSTGEGQYAELQLQRKDGTPLDVSLNVSAERDDEGYIVYFRSIWRDITDRKQAQFSLMESEEKFRAVFNGASEGILIIDVETKEFIYANPSICKMLGYSEKELTRMRISDIRPSDSQVRVFSEFEAVFKKEKTFISDLPCRCKDGALIYVDISSSFISISGLQNLAVFFTDITERKQAEEALLEGEIKFKNSYINARVGLFRTRISDGKLLECNDLFAQTVGYETREECLAEFVELENYVDPHVQKIMQVEMLKSGEVRNFNANIIKKDGTPFWVSYYAKLFPEIGCIEGAAIDISDRRHLEEEIMMAPKAGVFAHNFNNIITSIWGSVQLAVINVEKAGGKETLELLRESEIACKRAQGLTQQLFTFAGVGKPVKKITSIAPIIMECSKFAVHGSNVRCMSSIPKDLWQIEADEGQLRQALNNIIINADQVMPEGGDIIVSAENILFDSGNKTETVSFAYEKYIKISVEDHGNGIPEDQLSKIFDPYFTTKRSGSGLGLTTCYSIIKNHGGHIDVKSEIGVGSTFEVYLPASLAVIKGHGKILLMDDEDQVKRIAGKMLKQIGYEVEFASNGDEAIEMYEKAKQSDEPYDAVILNLTIPGGMGGKECIKKFLEIDPDVKAIISSGYSNDPVMSNFEDHGFKGVLPKPFQIKQAGEVLSKVIGLNAG